MEVLEYVKKIRDLQIELGLPVSDDVLDFLGHAHEIVEEFGASTAFPAPPGEPCYPSAIDNEEMRYFAPLLAHRHVYEVRVGGIPWNRSVGQPEPGEWTHDRFRGIIQLGGKTGRGRVIAYLAQ